MVDYQQLKTSDTTALRELGRAWSTTVRELTVTGESLETGVWRPLLNGEVNGVTISAASWRSKNFAIEIDNGANEATNLKAAVEDHADGIDALKARLATLEGEIAENPILESLGDGTVVYKPPPDDIDEETAQARERSGTALANSYTEQIAAVVKDANEHDTAMSADLANIAELHHDGNVTFNDGADRVTTERAEAAADEAAELMEKADGQGLSPRDQSRLNELLSTYGDVPAFAVKLVEDLGTEGLLDLSGSIAVNDTGTQHTDVAEFQKYLGQTLATALSADPELERQFTEDLKALGTRSFPYDGVAVQGYQILGPLLENGTYPKDFLLSVNEDLIRLSASGHHWDTGYAGNPVDPVGDSHADPLNYGLTALGHNPEASLEFFNGEHPPLISETGAPVTQGGDKPLGYLGYLMSVCGEGYPIDPTTVGHAVEAASTGLPYDAPPETPRPEHTQGMVDLTERVVNFVAENPSAFDGSSADKHDLVMSLSDITVNYIEDFHRGYSDAQMHGMPGSHGVPLDFGVYEAEGGQKQTDLKGFMQVLGQDPEAYGKLWTVSNAMAADELSRAVLGPHEGGQMQVAMGNSLEPHSRMMIDLSLGQYNAIHDGHISAVEAHNGWVKGGAEGAKLITGFVTGRFDPSGVVPTGLGYLIDGYADRMATDPSNWIEQDQKDFAEDHAKQMQADLDGLVDTVMDDPAVRERVEGDSLVPEEMVRANVQLYEEVLSEASTVGRK